MFKTALWATLALAGAASPAVAGSWGFGVGVGYGPPRYWGPPPVYYDYGAPIIVEPAPPYYYYEEPPVYYEEPPVVVVPPEPPILYGMVNPDVVLDALEMAGYSDLQPMRQRGSVYQLNAIDPDGNLVRLDISVHTGDIERERVLEMRYEAAPAAAQSPRQALQSAAPLPPPATTGSVPSSSLRERLQTPAAEPGQPVAEERDPLVVY